MNKIAGIFGSFQKKIENLFTCGFFNWKKCIVSRQCLEKLLEFPNSVSTTFYREIQKPSLLSLSINPLSSIVDHWNNLFSRSSRLGGKTNISNHMYQNCNNGLKTFDHQITSNPDIGMKAVPDMQHARKFNIFSSVSSKMFKEAGEKSFLCLLQIYSDHSVSSMKGSWLKFSPLHLTL